MIGFRARSPRSSCRSSRRRSRCGGRVRSKASSGTSRMSGKTSGASGFGSRMPQTPAPADRRTQRRAWSAACRGPRPPAARAARPRPRACASAAAGLISLLSGMKPETIAPGATATGNGRAAMVCAAPLARIGRRQRVAARRCASRRSARLGSLRCEVECVIDRRDSTNSEVRSRDGRWSVDPGFPTKVGGRHMSEPTSPARDSSL